MKLEVSPLAAFERIPYAMLCPWTLNSRVNLLITARVRSTREGNIYTWECLSVHHWWGVPQSRFG